MPPHRLSTPTELDEVINLIRSWLDENQYIVTTKQYKTKTTSLGWIEVSFENQSGCDTKSPRSIVYILPPGFPWCKSADNSRWTIWINSIQLGASYYLDDPEFFQKFKKGLEISLSEEQQGQQKFYR